ncbi:MAG: branched-chain amino acid ABC transporter permease [Alphaproteobacteria bacterium]
MKLDGRAIVLLVLLALTLALPLFGGTFVVKLATRIMIFSIAVIGLDILLGYTGLVSLGHAAFFGVGAYTVGILAHYGITSAFVAFPAAIGAAGLAALVIGALSLRTTGIYFIMITLAFAQMFYYFAQALKAFGGDDGFPMKARSDFAGIVDISGHLNFFYTVLVFMLVVLFIAHRIVRSRFGAVIRARKDNERRLAAVGFPPYRYKLVAFVISGAIVGLAGALIVNHNSYFSPNLFSWVLSGDLLVMCILGSVGTLVGPILGAAVFLGFEEALSDITVHWMFIMGPLIVARVLFIKDGLYGLLEKALARP